MQKAAAGPAAGPVPVQVALEMEVLERVPAAALAALPAEQEPAQGLAAVRVQDPVRAAVPVQGLARDPLQVPDRVRTLRSAPVRTPRWARARMLRWVPAPMPRQLPRASGSEKGTHSATVLAMEPEIRGSDRKTERVSAPVPAPATPRVSAPVTAPGIKA
jgi:hypothetical protein